MRPGTDGLLQTAKLDYDVPLYRTSRELVARMATNPSRGGVQRQLRTGNADLAAANIARESEIAELRNQIAIIRLGREPCADACSINSLLHSVNAVTLHSLKLPGSLSLRAVPNKHGRHRLSADASLLPAAGRQSMDP